MVLAAAPQETEQNRCLTAARYERSKFMNERWSLDALYTGFDSPEFQADLKKLDELCARYQELAAHYGTGAPAAEIRATLELEEVRHRNEPQESVRAGNQRLRCFRSARRHRQEGSVISVKTAAARFQSEAGGFFNPPLFQTARSGYIPEAGRAFQCSHTGWTSSGC